jgi:hypothetical protein
LVKIEALNLEFCGTLAAGCKFNFVYRSPVPAICHARYSDQSPY